jgi:hypothetical protein
MLVEPARIGPRSRRGRVRGLLALAAVPVALVSVLVVALGFGPPPTPDRPAEGVARPSAEVAPTPTPVPIEALLAGLPAGARLDGSVFPASVRDVPVRSIREALALLAAGRSDGLIAIGGYLTYVKPARMCLPAAVRRSSGMIFCHRETLLAGRPDSPFESSAPGGEPWARLGPHLHPIAMPGTYLPIATSKEIPLDRRRPEPAVVLGRFDDPRAGQCTIDEQPCEPVFAIEWVPWASGRVRPGTGATEPALREVEPRLDERDRRRSRLAVVPDSGPAMVELLLQPSTLARVDPAAGAAIGPAVGPVWYLRIFDDGGAAAATTVDWTPDVAWLVIDDLTGEILASSRPGD